MKDDWKQALQIARKSCADRIPAGCITIEEFAKKIRKSVSMARIDMQTLIAAGQAEKLMFRAERSGRIMPAPFYRLKK